MLRSESTIGYKYSACVSYRTVNGDGDDDKSDDAVTSLSAMTSR